MGIDTDGTEYAAPVALAATGRVPKRLPGIQTNLKGVHFCSVCDGPLYRDKNPILAVVGGDNAAAQHALTLSRVAARVILICRQSTLPMDAFHQSKLASQENITHMVKTTVIGLRGSEQVEAVVVSDGKSAESEISVDGVFLAVGWQPNTQFLDIAVKKNTEGYLLADQELMTSFPGLFAAGDLRDTDLYQVLTACADGARAACHALEYINQR